MIRKTTHRVAGRIQQRFERAFARSIQRWLNRRGQTMTRSGGGYIDADLTVRSSENAGLSVCEWLEANETEPKKRGRRDRIVAAIMDVIAAHDIDTVVEIGTGTGMYLDRIVERLHPERYQIYETSPGWRQYLKKHCRIWSNTNFQIPDADGKSLHESDDESADLVHAHGVFVYLSSIQTANYLFEMARVCRPGGFVIFDCYLDDSFDLNEVKKWIRSGWDFPVITQRRLLEELLASCELIELNWFEEIHGAGNVQYLIYQKNAIGNLSNALTIHD